MGHIIDLLGCISYLTPTPTLSLPRAAQALAPRAEEEGDRYVPPPSRGKSEGGWGICRSSNTLSTLLSRFMSGGIKR